MKQNTFPLARRQDIVVQQTNEDILVYDLKTNKVFCLNETSAAIWQLCDGKNDIAEITQKFQTQSNQAIPIELIEITLEKLSKENLLENYQPRIDKINKTSRREMIRKVALSTAIALPVITSLVAPSAIHAASCAPGLVFCPASTPFGFPMPAGCYDVQNGFTGIFPPPAVGCTFCGAVCLSGMCSGGICTP